MEASVELGLTVVISIAVFASLFAFIVGYGKKLTDEQNKKRTQLHKC